MVMLGPCMCGDPYCGRCYPGRSWRDAVHDEADISWQCEHKIHASCRVKNKLGKYEEGAWDTCGCDCHEKQSREPDYDDRGD